MRAHPHESSRSVLMASEPEGHHSYSQRLWAQRTVCRLLAFNVGSWPNGIKLASERLLDQLLAQCLPGFDHKWETLGPPFLDARFYPMRSDGVDDQYP